ncbi:MAG: tetratricopeptide repeat protein [Flavobacterium sp.]
MKKYFLLLFLCPFFMVSQSNFEVAEKLFLAEKYTQAAPLFELVLKNNPTDLRAIEYLGDIAGKQKAWDKALVYYTKLKRLKPNVANYYYKCGGAMGMKAKEVNKFKALGMISDIRSAFEKAIALDPKHEEARWALIELNLQLPGIVGGSQSKAIQYSNELLKISPVDGYLSRGHIEEYFNRYAAAEIQYKKAYEIGNSKVTFQKLYQLYLKKINNPKKAQELKDQFEKK